MKITRQSRLGVSASLVAITLALTCGTLWAQNQKPKAEEKGLISSLDGNVLYITYCATCHGDFGKGNGPMARVLKVPPPDLTQIAARRGGAFPVKFVEETIAGSDLASHGTREMPLWGPIFSQVAWDQDLGRIRIASLVQYLQSIQTKSGIGGIPNR